MNAIFCVKRVETPTDTYEMLQTLCGDEVLRSSNVSELFKRLEDGHEDLQDDRRSGCPSTA
jgi:hypothetical protein